MVTSLIQMVELSNFGYMTIFTIQIEPDDKIFGDGEKMLM